MFAKTWRTQVFRSKVVHAFGILTFSDRR